MLSLKKNKPASGAGITLKILSPVNHFFRN